MKITVSRITALVDLPSGVAAGASRFQLLNGTDRSVVQSQDLEGVTDAVFTGVEEGQALVAQVQDLDSAGNALGNAVEFSFTSNITTSEPSAPAAQYQATQSVGVKVEAE